MRKFGFRGFTEGSVVALSVSQNGQTRSGSVQAWGVNASATVQIETRLPQVLVAPAQVWVKAVNVIGLSAFDLTGTAYDGAFHEYFYYWSVRGAPLAPFNAPKNMIPQWNNPNVMGGKEAGFCLTAVGDYIIDLMVVDNMGNTAVAETQQISVISANDQYQNGDTICVSFAGAFAGKPDGATEVTSVAALSDAILANDSPNTRVLFNRGETFADFNLRIVDQRRASYFGSYGPSTVKPTLQPVYADKSKSSIISITSGKDLKCVVMTGLRFESDWNPASETGSWGTGRGVDTSQFAINNGSVLFHDLEFEGQNISLLIGQRKSATAINNRFMVADVSITGWKDYGLFVFKAKEDLISVIGNKIAQNVDALNGGNKSVGFMNNHGPARFADVLGVYVSMNDIFSRTGWSGLDQQCLRYTTAAMPNQWTYTDRNVMEGGYLMVSLQGANPGVDDLPGNHLIERNLMIGTAMTNNKFVGVHKGGTIVRGNYCYTPANKWVEANRGHKSAFRFNPDKSRAGNEDEPVGAYSNTVVMLRDDVQAAGSTFGTMDFEDFMTVLDENNLLHVPNLASPVLGSAPLDLSQTIPGVTLRYKGVRVGFEPVALTLPTGGIADGADLLVPYTILHQRLAAKARPPQHTSNVNDELDTDQGYWLSNDASDVRHTMTVKGIGPICAHLGHFTVSFASATHVTITNTSGMTWGVDGPNAKLEATLKLDRTSKIPAMDTSFAHDGQTVPLAVPADNTSAAWQSAAGQFVAPRGFITGAPRIQPISQGAL